MSASLRKRISWQIEAAAHSGIAVILSLLPAATVYRFGEMAGRALWPVMTKRQHNITRNLRIALAPISPEEAEKLAKENFIRTVANLVSSAISEKSKGGSFEEMVVIENPEVMAAAAAEGRGVILLTAHMGNWEALTRLHRTFPKGVAIGAFYRPLNNEVLNERVIKERLASGAQLFSKRDSLHKVGAFLRENGVIGILADQRVGHQGAVTEFFGRITRSSPLPSLLVRRCKSEVLAISAKTIAPGKWSVRYHNVEKPYNTDTCMKALETAMKVSPLDVFWLQERWKTYSAGDYPLTRWLKKEDVRGRLPHRALIWRETDSGVDIPADYQHGDVEYEEVIGKTADDLEEIDRAKNLPIDFILLEKPNTELAKKAKKLCIPIIAVSDWSAS